MTGIAPVRPAADTQALEHYLQVLSGPAPRGRLLEIRFALHDRGMGRLFIAAHRRPGAARLLRRLGARTDVYVGVCLRNRRSGGRDAIDHCHLAFVEIDTPDAIDRLTAFPHPPTIIVSSGTPGHAHAYYALSTPVTVTELETANRRLAHALGGDPASIDAARILRPPSTHNHKHTPPTPVELIDLNPYHSYKLPQLMDRLTDPPDRPPAEERTRRSKGRTELDRLLLAIPAADYTNVLTGATPNRSGKIHCPFHDDHTPSLQLYPDGTFYCYGCRAGGSIYDFAARLWRTDTKGHQFLALRVRLANTLGLRNSAH